jgi:hypothetical protein
MCGRQKSSRAGKSKTRFHNQFREIFAGWEESVPTRSSRSTSGLQEYNADIDIDRLQ